MLKSGAVDLDAKKSDEIINPAKDLSIASVLRDYVVLLGKGGGIFNDKRCEVMSKSDFTMGVGPEVSKIFFDHPDRRVIHRCNLVFDPTSIDVDPGYINLFRGFSVIPKKGACSRWLALLLTLCENNDEVLMWVLRWLAYPLQNPGAKMRTAIVIHGGEGTGKNLILSVLLKIYGSYSAIITQTDLEGVDNGWASRKLFINGNEVVSRQEMYHKKGVIKNMITEPQWNINEKYISPRKESNHANFVFTSNFLQPVSPDKDDRRYLVLWTPPKLKKNFYEEVAKEISDGGVAAVYDYLLSLDMGDFDEFTEPLMTKAKGDLIDISMKSDERFITYWLEGDIDLITTVCRTQDLYQAYVRWCKTNGEKFHVSQTEFGNQLGKHEELEKVKHQRYLEGQKEKKGTFVIPGGMQPLEGQNRAAWLTECNDKFKRSFEAWCDESRDAA